MASVGYHEPLELLSGETRDMHRAIVSLMEELEAIDWYQQRADACSDPVLKDILRHDKNEEIELYLTESFAFRVLERAAAVYLKP